MSSSVHAQIRQVGFSAEVIELLPLSHGQHAKGKRDCKVQMIRLYPLGKINQLFRQFHCCEQAWAKQVQWKCIKNLENWLNLNFEFRSILVLRSGKEVTWNKKSISNKSVLPVSIKCEKSLNFRSKYKKLSHLLGCCCGRSLWIKMNFTLVVSEKSSLICCGQSTLIHTYPSLGISLGKALSHTWELGILRSKYWL